MVQEFQLETGGMWGDVPLHKLQYLNQSRKCMWTTALWSCIEGLIILLLLTEAVLRFVDKKKSFEVWAMSILEARQVSTMTCKMVMETLWFTTLILKNCLPANKTVLQRGTIWGWFCWWLSILRMRGQWWLLTMVFGDWLLGWGAGTMVDFGLRWLRVVSVCSTMCILSMVTRNCRHSVFTSTTCSCKHIFLLIAEVSPFPSKNWGWLPFRRQLLIWRQSYHRIALAIEACCMVASWSTKEWRMFVVVPMPRPTQCKTEYCKQCIEEESSMKFEITKKRNYKTKKWRDKHPNTWWWVPVCKGKLWPW